MANIPIDLAKTYLEKLINGAIAESRYICCFASIAEEYEKEKEKLKAKRSTVEKYVEVANRRVEDIRSDVTFWQKEANDLIQEDTKTKMTCFFGLCPNCKWQYSRGKELADKTEEIRRLMQCNFESVGINPSLPDVEYHSSQDYISFKSRGLKCKELSDALKDDNNYLIGLQGMGGTGKTTLAKQVGKELKQSKQFDQVIDTTVSYTPDIKKIQDDIAGPLGLRLNEYNESERPKILWSRLTNGDKILIILDDVWVHINFEEIGIPYSDNHKGCRVLLTTRNLWVCNSMGCEKTIQLELLSEHDAWILFQKHAGISDTTSKRLLDHGRKIAKECKGLPVAIAATASSLKGEQRPEEWNAALKSLQKSVPMQGVDENLVKIYNCLRCSYDNLKNEKAKGLFLLCSMFPEDEEISVEILTRFSIGVGLFGEVEDQYDEARSQVVVAKNKLIDSCLLLNAGEEHVKMHDLIREVALWIANKEIHGINLYKKSHKSLVEREKNIKYLSCEGKGVDIFSCRINGSKLEILNVYMYGDEYGDDSLEVPNSFFEHVRGLRVLRLSFQFPYGKARSLSLRNSIQFLTNLRSLFLRQLKLGDISILGKLQSLETLELVFCTMVELPREIGEFEKLLLLKLDHCEIERKNEYEVIGRCWSLEELYINHGYGGFDEDIHEMITFPALQRYHLIRGGVCPATSFSVSKRVALSFFNLFLFSEATLKYLVRTTEILYKYAFEGKWRNLIPEIVSIDEGMNDLVILHLILGSQIQCIIDTSCDIYSCDQNVNVFFSKLVDLYLQRQDDLEELFRGPLPVDFLKSLERLSIHQCHHLQNITAEKSKLNLCSLKTIILYDCPSLVSLFQLLSSGSLVLLEELRIEYCQQLKSIIAGEESECTKTCGPVLPKLTTIKINRCFQLEFILPFLSAQDVPVLEHVNIKYCSALKSIFQNEHQIQDSAVFGSLKTMKLGGMHNFIGIFPKCYHPECSSVKRLPSKEEIKLDPIKRNIFPWTHLCGGYANANKYRNRHKSSPTTSVPSSVSKDNQQQDSIVSPASSSDCLHQFSERAQSLSQQSHLLRNINRLNLCYLSKIKFLFNLSIAPTILLEYLTIHDCDDLKQIIIIENGDECGGNNNFGDVFPKLKCISVKDCEQLEYIFGGHPHNDADDDNQNKKEIHLRLPTMKWLYLRDLPSLIGVCPMNYHTTMPTLTNVEFKGCPQLPNCIKSIGDLMLHLDSRQPNSITIVKDMSGNVMTLENLVVDKSEVENICFLNEKDGQQINLKLQKFELHCVSQMVHPFVGPVNSFTLNNLTQVTIKQCEKLEVIFSASIARCLPQLNTLAIIECKALKQIIAEDEENHKMSNFISPKTCFPKLRALLVKKCNKLKCVFPVLTSEEFPNLEFVIIKEAFELKQVFECEGDQKVEIPNLKGVLFANLLSLCRGIEFRTVKHRLVLDCPELSFTSTSNFSEFREFFNDSAYTDIGMEYSMLCMF